MVTRTERGWAGHFIAAQSCRFRLNTLLEYKNIKIVVSTVGAMYSLGRIEMIGHNRYFETMAFHADLTDKKYFDADVSHQVDFDSDWLIDFIDGENQANQMHQDVVQEISNKLLAGNQFEKQEN